MSWSLSDSRIRKDWRIEVEFLFIKTASFVFARKGEREYQAGSFLRHFHPQASFCPF
jgi:hypothetical protein